MHYLPYKCLKLENLLISKLRKQKHGDRPNIEPDMHLQQKYYYDKYIQFQKPINFKIQKTKYEDILNRARYTHVQTSATLYTRNNQSHSLYGHSTATIKHNIYAVFNNHYNHNSQTADGMENTTILQ